MHANSRSVSSQQSTLHPQLAQVIERHRASPFQKPVTAYNQQAFALFLQRWRSAGEAPLVLDAGCGVGLSTRHLATLHADCFVLGIDQSADRLARQTLWPQAPADNMLLLRADLVDFWRLLLAAQIPVQRHYLLYPNPWPKVGHLQRRWHGHAVFPTLVALGGLIECRSNWAIYIEELAAGLRQLGATNIAVEAFAPALPITPFEKKYLASGQALWRCTAMTQADYRSAADRRANRPPVSMTTPL